MCRRELSQEVVGSFLDRERRLRPQGAAADDPLDLVGFQKTVAPSLSFLFLSHLLHLFLGRQLFSSDLPEPVQAQLPDLVAGDAEELADGGVASISRMVAVGHQGAVPQLDDVVDLGLGELLHL